MVSASWWNFTEFVIFQTMWMVNVSKDCFPEYEYREYALKIIIIIIIYQFISRVFTFSDQ